MPNFPWVAGCKSFPTQIKQARLTIPASGPCHQRSEWLLRGFCARKAHSFRSAFFTGGMRSVFSPQEVQFSFDTFRGRCAQRFSFARAVAFIWHFSLAACAAFFARQNSTPQSAFFAGETRSIFRPQHQQFSLTIFAQGPESANFSQPAQPWARGNCDKTQTVLISASGNAI